MATKRKRGATWHYTVRRKGLLDKPIYLSFQDERDGDIYVAKLEGLLAKGIVPSGFQRTPERPTTLREVVSSYLETQAISDADRVILDALDLDFLKTPLSQLSYEWAEAQVAALKDQRLAPGTIRHRIGALARCLDRAARRGELLSNPLRLLPRGYSTYPNRDREDESRDRRLEPGEEAAIRRVLAGGYAPPGKQRALVLEYREALILMFELALETAMRLREIYTLEKRQCDRAKRTIFLEKTKNGDKRQIPMSSIVIHALDGWLDGSGLLLPFFCGDVRKTTARLSWQWARVFDHAGCSDLHWHDLRHEATCRLFEQTSLSDLQISLITGHKDPRMLRRYANLRGSDLADALW